MELKKYKITNNDTGQSFVITASSPPSQADAKKIFEQREKTRIQGETANKQYRERGIGAKLADYLYAPSEAIAPEVMAPEEVEKLSIPERLVRIGRTTASGLLDPENAAITIPALVGGPLGLAASGITGLAAMTTGLPKMPVQGGYEGPKYPVIEAGKQLYEHPSLETGANAALMGLGIAGGMLGTHVGLKGLSVDVPKVTPPISRAKALIPERNPIDAEFVDFNMPGRVGPQGQIEQKAPLLPGDVERQGPIRTGPSPLPEQNLLVNPPTPRQISGTVSPIIVPPSPIEAELQTRQITGANLGQRQLEAYYGNLSKKRTTILLKQREGATGKERLAIDEILKRRGALPDEQETMQIETPVPEQTQEQIQTQEQTSIQEQSKEQTQLEVQAPEQQKLIENTWLRETDSSVLQAMREGSSGKMREEIDTVLSERGLGKEEKVTQTKEKLPINEKAVLKEAIAEFPKNFSLRAYPEYKFRISPEKSFIEGDKIHLVTQMFSKGKWLDFDRNDPREIMREMIPYKERTLEVKKPKEIKGETYASESQEPIGTTEEQPAITVERPQTREESGAIHEQGNAREILTEPQKETPAIIPEAIESENVLRKAIRDLANKHITEVGNPSQIANFIRECAGVCRTSDAVVSEFNKYPDRPTLLIHADDKSSVWLLGWRAGQNDKTLIHDHGPSLAHVQIVKGNIQERLFIPDWKKLKETGEAPVKEKIRNLTSGDISIPQQYIHEFANPTDELAASLHVYSPPLDHMGFFEISEDGKTIKKVGQWDNDQPTSKTPTVEEEIKEPSIEEQEQYGEESEKFDEQSFQEYQDRLDDLVSRDIVSSTDLQAIAELGKKAGLDQDTVVGDMLENAPRLTNASGKIYNATNKVFRKGEAGFGTIDFFTGWRNKAKKAGVEGPVDKTIADLGFFRKSFRYPESMIGKMGEAGLRIRRKLEEGQYYADTLKGKVDTLMHDAFQGLTPVEAGQRRAILDNGKEIVLNKKNMDKYVDWKDGVFSAKKGVQRIVRMRGSLSSVILDGEQPANERIGRAAQYFRQAMDVLGTEGEKSGVSAVSAEGKHVPFEKMGADYWPREYTDGFFESLKRDPRDWNRIIKDVSNSKKISLKEAEELLNNKKLYTELTTRAQHQRTFKQDSFVIDPDVAFDHARNFSGRVGVARALGPKDIREGPLANDIRQLKNEGFDWKFAQDTIERFLGREEDKAQPTEKEQKVYKSLTDLNNLRLMTSFLINNLANVTTTTARVGPINTLKGLGAALGNMEMSYRMATLSGATEHTGVIERSSASVAKLLGVPISERFMRTWADQSGRITANGLIEYLNDNIAKKDTGRYIRGKKLLDSLLGKDSTETIKRGVASPEELQRAGWQLAKDSQGIINPATVPPLGENIKNPAMRLGVNLAMQYKRMALLGMNSLYESLKLNPVRTITTLAITAPIIGEVIGDAGSALFGGLAGAYTGEGAMEGAIRDVDQRGKSLSRMLKPILQDKLGVDDNKTLINALSAVGITRKPSDVISRYIDDANRGFALGLIGDFFYSVAYMGRLAAGDTLAGGISPIFEFIVDIATSIMDGGKDFSYLLMPQRFSSAVKRSERGQTGSGAGGLFVRPPSLPSGF